MNHGEGGLAFSSTFKFSDFGLKLFFKARDREVTENKTQPRVQCGGRGTVSLHARACAPSVPCPHPPP